MRLFFLLPALFLLIFLQNVSADILYLKNDRSIEGIITRQTDTKVDLDVGFGTVTLEKSDISRIHKSDHQETRAIKNKWDANKQKAERIKLRAEGERQQAIEEWRKKQALHQEEERLREKEMPGEADLSRAAGHMTVEAVLNGNVEATLLVDTGASVMMLTNALAKKLGIDVDREKADIDIQVADGRQVKAKYIILRSVRIKNTEAKNVEAAVLIHDIPGPGFKDGLLGMSFLKRFNFKFDYSNDRLILENR